jgi:membrane protease subunit HflK
VIVSAEGDASRFKQVLTEYAKAPAVTRERLYLDTMQQIFANTSKVYVDSRVNNSMLYLPLDRLVQQAGSDAARVAAAGQAAAQVAEPRPDSPQPPAVAPGREGLRGRDREAGR